MNSLPFIKMPVMFKYMDKADMIIYYFHQLLMSEKVQNGERLPTEETMASNLDVPVMDVSRVLFKLHLYGLVTRDKGEFYVSAMNIKLKQHIFSFLLSGKPSILQVNDYPMFNDMAANNQASAIAHSVTMSVQSVMAK